MQRLFENHHQFLCAVYFVFHNSADFVPSAEGRIPFFLAADLDGVFLSRAMAAEVSCRLSFPVVFAGILYYDDSQALV